VQQKHNGPHSGAVGADALSVQGLEQEAEGADLEALERASKFKRTKETFERLDFDKALAALKGGQ
jgi:hypothetical protein